MAITILLRRCGGIVCLLIVFFLSSCSYKESQINVVPLEIACIGDSITYGYKLSDPVQYSYPSRLARKSSDQWRVLNLGVNGATVVNKGDIPYVSQDQYKKLMNAAPDVVVIMLGSNDLKNNNWSFLSDFVPDYTRLVKNVQNLASHPQIILCSVPPIFTNYSNGINSDRQKQINSLVSKVVETTGAEYLDVSGLLLNKKDYFIDGVHPNNAGANEIAQIVFNRISKLQFK